MPVPGWVDKPISQDWYTWHFVLLWHQGWGVLNKFPPFHYFPNFSALSKCISCWISHLYLTGVTAAQNFTALSKHMLAIEYHIIFDRCWRSCAAATPVRYECDLKTPVRYECDLKNLTGTFAKSKLLLMGKLTKSVHILWFVPGVNETELHHFFISCTNSM